MAKKKELTERGLSKKPKTVLFLIVRKIFIY